MLVACRLAGLSALGAHFAGVEAYGKCSPPYGPARAGELRDVTCGSLSLEAQSRSLSLTREIGAQGPPSDPLLPFEIGPMNGREARKNGLRLMAWALSWSK